MSVTVLGVANSITGPLLLAPVTVECGFPSPSQDYYFGPINLDDELIKNRAATFLVRVSGSSMVRAGIHDGDVLIVDRSLEPRHGDVIVAVIDGDMTVKRLLITATGVVLHPENPHFPDLRLREEELIIWGVVKHCIHALVNEARMVHGA